MDREKEAEALQPLAVALAKLSTLQVGHRMIEQMRLHEYAGVALAEGAARFFPSTATRASLAAKEMASIRDSVAGAHRDAVVAGSRGCHPDAPLDLAHVILKEKVGSKLGLVCLYLEAGTSRSHPATRESRLDSLFYSSLATDVYACTV